VPRWWNEPKFKVRVTPEMLAVQHERRRLWPPRRRDEDDDDMGGGDEGGGGGGGRDDDDGADDGIAYVVAERSEEEVMQAENMEEGAVESVDADVVSEDDETEDDEHSDSGEDGDDGHDGGEVGREDNVEGGCGEGPRGGLMAAVEVVEVVEHLHFAPGKVQCTMKVPGIGDVHKRVICAWVASGSEKLSAALSVRQAQASSRSCIDMDVFTTVDDEWVVQLGTDIAVLFEERVWLGKITRIRRRYTGGSWANYVRPVHLDSAKAARWQLYFTLSWYNDKVERNNIRVYQYGLQDTKSVRLVCVICPVALTRVRANGFTLSVEQQRTVDECKVEVAAAARQAAVDKAAKATKRARQRRGKKGRAK
jgi:hypothetical protein